MLFEASLFINEVWDKRINFKFWDAVIRNMDDTPLFFNMSPNKIVAKRSGKSIIIKTQNQEKCRISALLAISANRIKLPPYFIFKAKSNGEIEKNCKMMLML